MFQPLLTRRDALRTASCGFGYLALAGLTTEAAATEQHSPLAPRPQHFPVRAKRVIFMFMRGGPSQLETFDYKPELIRRHDEPMPGGNRRLMKPRFDFQQCGESGLHMSTQFTHLSKHADELCIINSMHTDTSVHGPGIVMMHTGNLRLARPSIGSWVVYGLGSESQELPGFVVLNPLDGPAGGARNYSSAFLPSSFEGTTLHLGSDIGANAIANIRAAAPPAQQRQQLDLLQSFNRDFQQQSPGNTDLEGVIESYERAFRMQTGLPRVLDLSKESQRTLKMYGVSQQETGTTRNARVSFAMQCLLARRMAEAGVRFIEISTVNVWDNHANVAAQIPNAIRQIDQPIAALITDLKQRGMLDETLLVWSGEFGRTVTRQNSTGGRDHNGKGFTCWLAGGGVKGGMRYGATDELGSAAVENRVHVHDLHATVLHLLGLDHERLTYRYAGRDFRLTDVAGRVVKEIIA